MIMKTKNNKSNKNNKSITDDATTCKNNKKFYIIQLQATITTMLEWIEIQEHNGIINMKRH